jgi:hypothetical protein
MKEEKADFVLDRRGVQVYLACSNHKLSCKISIQSLTLGTKISAVNTYMPVLDI